VAEIHHGPRTLDIGRQTLLEERFSVADGQSPRAVCYCSLSISGARKTLVQTDLLDVAPAQENPQTDLHRSDRDIAGFSHNEKTAQRLRLLTIAL
jgi:hypothetical protein